MSSRGFSCVQRFAAAERKTRTRRKLLPGTFPLFRTRIATGDQIGRCIGVLRSRSRLSLVPFLAQEWNLFTMANALFLFGLSGGVSLSDLHAMPLTLKLFLLLVEVSNQCGARSKPSNESKTPKRARRAARV